MATWFLKRGQRLLALTLMLAVLMLSGALVVYADSTVVLSDPDAQTLQTTPEPPYQGPPPQGQPPQGAPPQGQPPQGPPPSEGHLSNAILNGSFEKGFVNGVAEGWGSFQNGNVAAGWYDDSWDRVVFDGGHAQLMELKDAREMDRYVGIYQTVHVAPDSDYLLTLHGLVRSVPGSVELTDFGFRMQYGIDYRGGGDWKSSEIEWIELPWDEQPRTEPTHIESFSTTIKTKGPQLSLFIRGWKKWADAFEGDYDVDGVSLVGPLGPSGKRPPHDMQPQPGMQPPPGQQPPPGAQPSPTPEPQMPVSGNAFSILGNPVVAVPSIALLLVLIGGATWELTRRRE